MGPERQNPPETVQLGGREVSEGSSARMHPERVARLGDAKKRSRQMGMHILRASEGVSPFEGEILTSLGSEVLGCANYLVFHNYFTVDQVRLAKITTCKKHLVCPVCARIRAAKQVQRYVERLEIIQEAKPGLRLGLLTLTVKNGDDLQERFQHLVDSWKIYQRKRRQYFIKDRGFNELCKVSGAVFSYEVTNKGNGWHPHLHAVVCLDEWIDQEQLSEEWKRITGDSFVVDIRSIKGDPVEGFLEVFKYALKFSELSLENNLEAYKVLRGRRLQGSFGDFHGVQVPEQMTDDLLEDLPYLELLYRFAPGRGCYDLAECRTVTSEHVDMHTSEHVDV